jgi:hypothetical protein
MKHRFYLIFFIMITVGLQTAIARPKQETKVTSRNIDLEKITNNEYFMESQRLLKLSEEAFNQIDYDASYRYAMEAIYFAVLSDVHVAILTAKHRIDWAESSGASKQYSAEFNDAQRWYNISLGARNDEEWEKSIDAAHRVVELLANIHAPGIYLTGGTSPLPATYIVREWLTTGDCLWNIAARSWVYDDPFKWRILYDANKSKLPNPDNPDLIKPGMVLDIPSIMGEIREGEWDIGKTYNALR